MWDVLFGLLALCLAAGGIGVILRFVRHSTIAGLFEDRDRLRAAIDLALEDRRGADVLSCRQELDRINQHLEALGVDFRKI